MKLSLLDMEREVSRLWDEEARTSRASRVELVTLVTLVSKPSLLNRALEVVEQIEQGLPARAITAAWHAADGDSVAACLDADISLRRASPTSGGPTLPAPPTPPRIASGDAMVLRAYGPAREWIPAAVERLLLSDVPVCIWWLGELAPLGTYFDRVLRCADLLVVSSSDLSLGDLEKISEFARGRADLRALADLTWARLRTMRELVARFFDDAALMPQLERLSHIAIGYSPHPTADARDVASTEAALLMGWLAAALGFLPDSARWSRDPRGAELTILRSGQVAPIVIRLDREARDDVPRGSVLRVALTSGAAQVEVARQAQDACLLECECRAPGLVVPRQLVRAFFEEDPCLLSGYLVRPLRDRIFEASLHIASQIFRSIVHASRS